MRMAGLMPAACARRMVSVLIKMQEISWVDENDSSILDKEGFAVKYFDQQG